MKYLVFLLSLVALAAAISERIPNFLVRGKCPVVNEKALFDEQKPNHSKYAGRWYEVQRSENKFQDVKQCTANDLTYNGAGFDHITTGLDEAGNQIRREGQIFEFTDGDDTEPSHLSIKFEQQPLASPYVILDTDYENYSCIYSCVDFSSKYVADFLFVWSRTPIMEDQYLEKCLEAFREVGLDVKRLEKVPRASECDGRRGRGHVV